MKTFPSTLDFNKMDPQVPIENWIVMEYSSMEFFDLAGNKRTTKKDPKKRKKREIHPYRLPTREGDWNRRLYAQEGKVMNLLQQKWDNNGQYYNIKTMYKDFLESAYMDRSKKELHYGRPYQIYNDEVPTSPNPDMEESKRRGFYLSAVLSVEQLCYEYKCHVEDNCQLMASLMRKPMRRNTYVFEKADEPEYDGKMSYSDSVYIRTAHTPQKLYLRCVSFNAATFDNSGNPTVFLSEIRDLYSMFKIEAQGHLFRDDKLIWFIMPRTKLMFRHIMSGKYMTAEYPKWRATWFGPELLVSCCPFTDLRGCEKIEQHWRLKTDLGDEDEPEEDPLAAIKHLGPEGT